MHQHWLLLLLGAVACVATATALPRGWWARPPFGIGVAVPVGLGATPRPEGDYLVGSDAHGYVLLALTLALVVGALVSSVRPRPGAPS